MYVFFGKEKIYIDFNKVMRNDRPKGNQSCMYTCMICKSENKNLKCHEEIVILNVLCEMEIRFDCSSAFAERTGEGDRKREEKERGKKEERERGVNLVEINKFFNCIRL